MVMISVDQSESSSSLNIPKEPKEMISVTQGADGRTYVRINSSSVSTIQECLRKAQYSLHEKWTPETEAPSTLFGTAIHKALEVFYLGDFTERKLPRLEDMEYMSYGHKVAKEDEDLLLRATRAFLEKAKPLSSLPESDKRSPQTGVYLLWHYFKAFIDDPYRTYVDEQGPFVERKFTFRIHEYQDLVIDYFGTIDLALQHSQTGQILIADHKTSSVVGADFYNRLKPNHQYTGYLGGAIRVFKIPTNSFLVNCLQVKERPKTARGTPPHLPRQITTRDSDDFEEFADAVIHSVHQYLHSMKTGMWPIGQTNACATYGGCKYLAVCSAPKSMRENILNAKFIKQGGNNAITK